MADLEYLILYLGTPPALKGWGGTDGSNPRIFLAGTGPVAVADVQGWLESRVEVSNGEGADAVDDVDAAVRTGARDDDCPRLMAVLLLLVIAFIAVFRTGSVTGAKGGPRGWSGVILDERRFLLPRTIGTELDESVSETISQI